MLVRIWRLVTLMLVALSMGVALAHLLEMPAKLDFSGALWLALLQSLYPPGFGTAGASFEAGAVLSSLVLLGLVRRRHPAFGWTLLGALAVLAAHASFWLWIAPVNATLLPLAPDQLPANWPELRDRWEYTHTARAVLQAIGLGAIAYSILVETPREALRASPSLRRSRGLAGSSAGVGPPSFS